MCNFTRFEQLCGLPLGFFLGCKVLTDVKLAREINYFSQFISANPYADLANTNFRNYKKWIAFPVSKVLVIMILDTGTE